MIVQSLSHRPRKCSLASSSVSPSTTPRTASAFSGRKPAGHRDLVTVVGHAAIISAGEWITASGEWINGSRPRSAVQGAVSQDLGAEFIDGIEKYLGSGRSGHLGCSKPRRWSRAFGEKARHHRGRARSASRDDGHRRGSSQTDHGRLGRAEDCPGDPGLPSQPRQRHPPWAVRIFKTYGADAVQVMTENPYRLARYSGHRF